ncbi:hypothetical protein TorRG33x02_198530 [Trema orientale]|uniref:Uncharacterized protein n=1 Tax=Trema orientale TaxID=63057 RepID=A0A2P5EFS1_TREOI|nr:hypothetical protein TorRG33x02_198530 [Trema orientale]
MFLVGFRPMSMQEISNPARKAPRTVAHQFYLFKFINRTLHLMQGMSPLRNLLISNKDTHSFLPVDVSNYPLNLPGTIKINTKIKEKTVLLGLDCQRHTYTQSRD